jgi:hypothetical protein
MSSLTKIEDISPLNAEFLSIQELGMRITEFREKIYKDPLNPELQSTLFTIKMDTLGRITPVLRKVLDFRFSSEKKNLLLQNIHEFILSYTDTDAADELTTEENINIRDNFENLVEQFLRIINWGNREDFDQSVDDNIINKITTNFQYHKMDDLSVGESFEGLKIGSLWRITKELFKKVIIGKTTISTQNLPFLTTFLLLTHRFADVTSYNELSAQKIFPAASPLWRAIFSEVDLFIEENKGNPIFIEFLTRNSIHDPINKIAILQWMFFSEDRDRYTEDEHNLICDLNNEKYKILFFFKEKIAFYLYQLSN